MNIVDRGFLELLQPLSSNQVATIGFLWLVKLVIRIFGFHKFALCLVLMPLLLLFYPPYITLTFDREQVGDLLELIGAKVQPGEQVYVVS